VLWGEGTFHQYHGGTSSGSAADRSARLEAFRNQYDAIRGRRFATFEREPLLVGTCPGNAHQLMMAAASLGQLRYHMLRAEGQPEWSND
jgi:hypothetical protein